jgi:hypothetical protein
MACNIPKLLTEIIMKKIVVLIALCLVLVAGTAIAVMVQPQAAMACTSPSC